MIEQTELIVTEWHYHPPEKPIKEEKDIQNFISLDVMKKRATTKKGLACKFNCRFVFENKTILEYTGEDSYVIDFEDVINKIELLRMINNSYTKFNATFNLRKLNTILQNRSLRPLDESMIDLDAILPLLA